MYLIEYLRQVFKDLDKISNDAVQKTVKVIKQLSQNPFPWGYKKLSGRLNAYRIRTGDYRIIYLVSRQENKIRIMRIRHRQEVYRDLEF